MNKIKVLLIDDSALALNSLKNILDSDPEFEVIGMAKNGLEALNFISANPNKIDVISTDLHMPVMDGLEFTKQIMQCCPVPILVTSISVQTDNSQNIFKLLQAGALDVFPKPASGLSLNHDDKQAVQFRHKLKLISQVRVFKRSSEIAPIVLPEIEKPDNFDKAYNTSVKLIAIGGSTGAPEVFFTFLSHLPKNFPIPIVCVQHINHDFIDSMVQWLDNHCQLKVKVAQQGELIKPGHVYFAGDRHMEIDSNYRFKLLNTQQPVNNHLPSIDVMFDSLAQNHAMQTMGILLTGMGKDGALGITALGRAGALTIAQDKASCVVFGMPREAIKLGQVKKVLAPVKILELMLQIANKDN